MDYLSDKNPAGLNWIKGHLTAPEVEKQASEASGVFADRTNGEHPIGTTSEAWHSYAYLKTSSVKGPRTEALLKTVKLAGVALGLNDELEEIDRLVDTELSKSAAEAAKDGDLGGDYALEYAKGGELQRHFPIGTRYQLVKSAIDMSNQRWKLPLDWVTHASRRIVKKARELGVADHELPNLVLENGVEREVDFERAAKVAEQRRHYVDDDSMEIYGATVKLASLDSPENLQQYIDVFVDLDHLNGVDYTKHLNPYQAFYSGMDSQEFSKFASEHVLMDERVFVPSEAFKAIEDSLKVLFGTSNGENLYEGFKSANFDGVKLTNMVKGMDEEDRDALAKVLVTYAT